MKFRRELKETRGKRTPGYLVLTRFSPLENRRCIKDSVYQFLYAILDGSITNDLNLVPSEPVETTNKKYDYEAFFIPVTVDTACSPTLPGKRRESLWDFYRSADNYTKNCVELYILTNIRINFIKPSNKSYADDVAHRILSGIHPHGRDLAEMGNPPKDLFREDIEYIYDGTNDGDNVVGVVLTCYVRHAYFSEDVRELLGDDASNIEYDDLFASKIPMENQSFAGV